MYHATIQATAVEQAIETCNRATAITLCASIMEYCAFYTDSNTSTATRQASMLACYVSASHVLAEYTWHSDVAVAMAHAIVTAYVQSYRSGDVATWCRICEVWRGMASARIMAQSTPTTHDAKRS